MNTVGKSRAHTFRAVPSIKIGRSKFNRSHGLKTSLDGGYIVPIYLDQTLPGDSVRISYNHLLRMTTPLVPFMDNVKASVFFFHVPKRLIWDNFESYITGSERGKVGTTHLKYPQLVLTKADLANSQTLFDYFGLPINQLGDGKSISVNSLPFRAYNLIYNEWFRHEDLCDLIPEHHGDDGDTVADYVLRKRVKRGEDPFTTCLPWPQKGPDVSLGLSGNAPVIFGNEVSWQSIPAMAASGSPAVVGRKVAAHGGSANTEDSFLYDGAATGTFGNQLLADLSSVTAATVNDLRQAFQIQKLYERSARSGSRYVETILAHFGVKSPDARLQRPEYIGGGNIRLDVDTVAQTSGGTTDDTALGYLGAKAQSVGRVGVQYSSVEHGYIIGLLCITCDLTYQQGLDRIWTVGNRLEEYWPELCHIGEQPIYVKELFCDGSDNDGKVFGYNERYAEFRYKPSRITGKLRSTDPQSLDYWHLAQKFAEAPSLSQAFIEEAPPFERVLRVQNEPQFILDAWFDDKWIRPMSLFGTPELIDHF